MSSDTKANRVENRKKFHHLNEEEYRKIKLLADGGIDAKTVCEVMNRSWSTVKDISTSSSFEDYKQGIRQRLAESNMRKLEKQLEAEITALNDDVPVDVAVEDTRTSEGEAQEVAKEDNKPRSHQFVQFELSDKNLDQIAQTVLNKIEATYKLKKRSQK